MFLDDAHINSIEGRNLPKQVEVPIGKAEKIAMHITKVLQFRSLTVPEVRILSDTQTVQFYDGEVNGDFVEQVSEIKLPTKTENVEGYINPPLFLSALPEQIKPEFRESRRQS